MTLREAAAVSLAVVGLVGCGSTEGGPLQAAVGAPVPSLVSCVPLGDDLRLTGQLAMLSLEQGSLDGPITVTGVSAPDAPDEVTVDVVAILEPDGDGDFAPMSSFFEGPATDAPELSRWDVRPMPGEVSTDDSGVLLAAIITADPAVDTPSTFALDVITYTAGRSDHTLSLDHTVDVVAFEPFEVPDGLGCGEPADG